MGLLLSNCLKGVYEDLPTALAQPFQRQTPSRREALESMLANKDKAEVDGRRNTTAPTMLADTWRAPTIDSPSSGGATAADNKDHHMNNKMNYL